MSWSPNERSAAGRTRIDVATNERGAAAHGPDQTLKSGVVFILAGFDHIGEIFDNDQASPLGEPVESLALDIGGTILGGSETTGGGLHRPSLPLISSSITPAAMPASGTPVLVTVMTVGFVARRMGCSEGRSLSFIGTLRCCTNRVDAVLDRIVRPTATAGNLGRERTHVIRDWNANRFCSHPR